MAVRKLETLVQSVLARKCVVAGSERIGTRLADRATPTFLPFAWLPSNDHDADPNPLVNRGQPAMQTRRGLRAGRSVRSSWGHRSRHLSASACHRPWRSAAPAQRVTATYRTAGYKPAAGRRGGKPGAVN
jgi:hypothetical protein